MSNIKTYRLTITGQSPLLMHADNIEFRDQLEEWLRTNKRNSKAGDDRSPGFSWLGCLYTNGKVLTMPSDNLMTTFREGGSQVGAGGRKTFKAATQSGAVIVGDWPLLVDGKEIPYAPFKALSEERDFAVHQSLALDYGFVLFVKRAKIGQAKHVRVRPRFENWAASGLLEVWDDSLTLPVLQQIWAEAGRLKGLGDWRPGSKTPGQFGRFSVEIEEVKK